MTPEAVRELLDKIDSVPCTCDDHTAMAAFARELADDLRTALPDLADTTIGSVVVIVAKRLAAESTVPGAALIPGDEALATCAHILIDAACDLTRLERTT